MVKIIALFKACAERALEGIVSKHHWHPIALAAARHDGVGLSYAGAAFIALVGDERAHFFAEVERHTTSWAALKSSRLTDVRWCHPKLPW
jgi:molybdopterin-guanine dinucleotide biosynthesis protein